MGSFPIILNYDNSYIIKMSADIISTYDDGFFGISFRVETKILRTYEFFYITLF